MKTYLGNYLGIVISGGQKDPEKRGRCQIFIPHIMPTLYEGWNETGFKETGGSRNIKIIGDNLQDSLTSAEIEKLRKILPWSECAAPAVGAGPSVWMANDNTMSSSLHNNGYKDGKIVSLGSFEYSGGSFTDLNTLNQISSKASRSVGAYTGFCARETFRLALETYGPIYNPVLDITQTSENYNSSGEAYAKDHGSIYGGARVGSKDGPLAFRKIDVKSIKDVPPGAIALTSNPSDPDYVGHAAIKVDRENWNWGPGPRQSYGASGGSEVGGTLKIEGVYVPTKELLQQNYANAEYKEDVFIKPGGETKVENNPSGITQTSEGNPRVATVMSSRDDPTSEPVGTTPDLNTLAGKFAQTGDPNAPGIIASNVQLSFYSPTQETNDGTEEKPGTRQGIGNSNNKLQPGIVALSENLQKQYGLKNGDVVSLTLNNGVKFFGYVGDTVRSDLKDRFDIYVPRGSDKELASIPNGGSLGSLRLEAPSSQRLTGEDLDVQGPSLLAQVAGGSERTDSPYQHFVDIPSNPGGNSNNIPTGMFGYAMEGQAVWCFFREGDALFPVYFAASYGQEDWSRIYQNGGSGKDQAHSSWSLNMPGGGIEATSITDQDNTAFGPDNILEFRHNFGSVLRFTNSTSLLYSQYSHKQHVQQDYADIVMANREMRTFGDSNINVGQNQYIAVGKWDATAEEAANELQKIINEGMEIKSKEIQEQFKNGESSTVI